MEEEEILMSEFRALKTTIFNCSVKNRIASRIEGNVVFTRLCRSHLLSRIHFSQSKTIFDEI